MRAVAVGLIGAVLALGGAQAASCKLDGASLVASAEGEPVDGQQFRVVRLMSHFDRIKSPEVNDLKPDGRVTAVIEGNGQRYIIDQTYSGWGMPHNAAYSYPADDAAIAKINPARRSPKGEAARVDGSFDILAGPLEGVRLRPLNCS